MPELVRELERGGPARVGDRDHHVDVLRLGHPADLLRERAAHVEACLVHRRAVDHRIGPREIHELEDARIQRRIVRALPRVELAGRVHEDGFTGRHVAQHLEPQRLDGHRLRCHDVFRAAHRLVLADDERADAERIAECEQAVARDHRHDRIRAAAALVHARHGPEDRVRIEPMMLRRALELERQHVEQHLAVGIGVDVTEVELPQLAPQRLAVGEVAVVPQRDAERRIHVEGLRLELGERRSRGGIAAVADPRVAREVAHVPRAEHVLHEPRSLEHVEHGTFARDDACRILTAMLEEEKPVVEDLVDWRVRDHAQNTAHWLPFHCPLYNLGAAFFDNAAFARIIKTLHPLGRQPLTKTPSRRPPQRGQGRHSATNPVAEVW